MYIYSPFCRKWITLYRCVAVFIVPHMDIVPEDNKQPAFAAMHYPHSVFDIGHSTVIHRDGTGWPMKSIEILIVV